MMNRSSSTTMAAMYNNKRFKARLLEVSKVMQLFIPY